MRVPKSEDWLDSKLLDSIVKAVQKAKVASKYKQEFRVSSLPYCPLLALVEEKDDEAKVEEYDMSFYVNIGTAVHAVFQKFARNVDNAKLIGNWRCNTIVKTMSVSDPPSESITRCNLTKEFCSFKTAIKNHVCPHKLSTCKGDFEYVELEILYDGLTGHVDLLFKIGDKYFLLDIKTTGLYLFDSPKKAVSQGYYPSKKYWHQVETYSVLVEKQYKIKIHQYAILYVSRDRTSSKRKGHMFFVRKLTDEMRAARLKVIDNQVKNNALAVKYIKKPNKALLERIWKNRPCQTRKDYDKLMAHKFYDKVCEFHKSDTCQSGKVMKTIEKLYKE